MTSTKDSSVTVTSTAQELRTIVEAAHISVISVMDSLKVMESSSITMEVFSLANFGRDLSMDEAIGLYQLQRSEKMKGK